MLTGNLEQKDKDRSLRDLQMQTLSERSDMSMLFGFLKEILGLFGWDSEELVGDVTERDIFSSPVFQRELKSKGIDDYTSYQNHRAGSGGSDNSDLYAKAKYGVSQGVFADDNTADAAFRSVLNIGIERHVERSIARGVKYRRGGKGDGLSVDCSGLVETSVKKAMDAALPESGKSLSRIFGTHSDGQLVALAKKTGVLLRGQDVNELNLKACTIIGIDSDGKGSAGRKLGIDHVGIVYTDSETGKKMFAESRGSRGVMATPLDEWLEYAGRRGYKLYASDSAGLASDAQKQQVAARVMQNGEETAPEDKASQEISENRESIAADDTPEVAATLTNTVVAPVV